MLWDVCVGTGCLQVLAALFVQCIEDSLEDVSYDARLGGLDQSVSMLPSLAGFVVSTSGYVCPQKPC